MEDAHELTRQWLDRFAAAVENPTDGAIEDLFVSDGWWRDLLSCTWDLRTAHGAERIGEMLETFRDAEPTGFAIDGRRAPEVFAPVPEMRWVQALFSFETPVGRCVGVVRLLPDEAPGAGWRAWTVLTALDELKGHEEPIGHRRPWRGDEGPDHTKVNWLDPIG